MSETAWSIARKDNDRARETRNLVLRIVAVAVLAVLFWHTAIATGWQ
jgi:hypothetical protein